MTAASNTKTEKAVSQSWHNVGPLTLDFLAVKISEQYPHLPAITNENTMMICGLPRKLSLQLCDLGSTELLWLLSGLEVLDLANNSLSKLEGVKDLVNLKQLNVSHNKLSSLEGLAALKNLEILSAEDNNIEHFEADHLSGLDKLIAINLANNCIATEEELICLRVLPSLQSVNLERNPLCELKDYVSIVVAFLPHLMYLNGDRVPEETKASSLVKHKIRISEIQSSEELLNETLQSSEVLQSAKLRHERAGVLSLDDGSLFDSMFADDINAKILLRLPGADKLINRYREYFNSVCNTVFSDGLKQFDLREAELQILLESLQSAYDQSDGKARRRVSEISKEIEKFLDEIKEIEDEAIPSTSDNQDESKEKLKRAEAIKNNAEENLEVSAYLLLEEEVLLADQVSEVIGRAESELGKMVQDFLTKVADQFSIASTLAYTFYCKLRQQTTKYATCPNVLSLFTSPFDDPLESSSNDDLRSAAETLFSGEDSLSSSLGAIHDRHLVFISRKQRELKEHLESWLRNTIRDLLRKEWRRHRQRIQELNFILDSHRSNLHKALVPIVQQLDG